MLCVDTVNGDFAKNFANVNASSIRNVNYIRLYVLLIVYLCYFSVFCAIDLNQ